MKKAPLVILGVVVAIVASGVTWHFVHHGKSKFASTQVKVEHLPAQIVLPAAIGDEKSEPEAVGQAEVTLIPVPPPPAAGSVVTPAAPLPQTTAFKSPSPVVPAAPAVRGNPKIAIVIDDLGLDISGTRRAMALPAFVTGSFMPYATRLREQTKDARERGHELILHMPMEPLGHEDPGPGALLVDLTPDEIRKRFETALASFTGFDGVNNHMGSKFTGYAEGMEIVIDELQQRHLFFLDSRTSGKTVGEAIARQHGLPTIGRDIFLDDDMDINAVRQQMEDAERVARKRGLAVVIGHPHPATLEALETWLPDAEARGFTFVALHDVIPGVQH